MQQGWRQNAPLIVLGVLIMALSATWGRFSGWVWPLGLIIGLVGLINVRLGRQLGWFQGLVAILLVLFALARFFFIGQIREVEHPVSVQISPAGAQGAESEVAITLLKYPDFVLRVESNALANKLRDKPPETKARFEVVYDFDVPRYYKLYSVSGHRVSAMKRPGTLLIKRTSGGWKNTATDELDGRALEPWQGVSAK